MFKKKIHKNNIKYLYQKSSNMIQIGRQDVLLDTIEFMRVCGFGENVEIEGILRLMIQVFNG